MQTTSNTAADLDRKAAACIATYGDIDTAIQSFGGGFAGPRDLYHHLLAMRSEQRAAARLVEAV